MIQIDEFIGTDHSSSLTAYQRDLDVFRIWLLVNGNDGNFKQLIRTILAVVCARGGTTGGAGDGCRLLHVRLTDRTVLCDL